MSEKTEQPTEKKLRDGRKEGQVVKSMEITSGLQLAVILLFFHFFSDRVLQQTSVLMLLATGLINKPFVYALPLLTHAILYCSGIMLAFFFGMIAIATVSGVVFQVGLVIASKAIGFKGQHINPVSNIKQIFSMHSLMELLKSSLKVTLLCLVFIYLFYFYASTFRALPYCGLKCALPVFSSLVRWMWAGLMAFYIVLSVVDYAFQYHNTMKQQRMSKEDVKQEHKDTQGDPHTKKRQREMQREIQSGSLAQNVRQSVVVVRNPTHIAVCLGYHPVDMPVPKVLEKGSDARAEHIVDFAARNAISVVENIPLARALFYDVNCGESIPESLFEPIAALLRIVLDIDYAETDNSENH